MMDMQPINITNGVPAEIYVAIGRGRYDHSGGDYELAQDVAMAICAECKVEIDRLQTIVDKLPKTADGVPVVFGETRVFYVPSVYPPSQTMNGIVYAYTVGLDGKGNHASIAWERDGRITGDSRLPLMECYSTQAAAEAAGGTK